jgi:Zn-dependent peptidase ImmA (M78 family)
VNLSTEKIRSFFPEFNERAHDETDFWRVAQQTKTIVKETPLLIEGYYEYKNKRHYILINSNLSRFEWLLTAFHELTHRLLDAPYNKSKILLKRDIERLKQKQEERAENIALILLIPDKKLLEMHHTPFEDLHPFLQKQLIRRQRIYDNVKLD